MAGLKTLIVDDEPVARRVLREELEQYDGLTIVGEADDGLSALNAINALQPDLVFLDIQMPALSGIDVIRRLQPARHIPAIVIVTAWDQHAIQAFEAGAIDYLLKPVARNRLDQAVDRARKLCTQPDAAAEHLAAIQEATLLAPGSKTRRIVAKSGGEYLFLNADEVLAFEADGDIVWILTARRKFIATQTLRALEEKLRNSTFRRIHRNALVNVEHIRKMATLSSQRWLITLSNDQEFIVSKRQARTVKQLFAW